MRINFHSTVVITKDFDKMKQFYQDVLLQEIEFDFGNCIGFKGGFSLWQLQEEYPIAKSMGATYHKTGNKNLEICFDTDEFTEVIENLKGYNLNYLHEIVEEVWGQLTVRFYDPENNLVELGESIPCFTKRFLKEGMTAEEVHQKTSLPIEYINELNKEL